MEQDLCQGNFSKVSPGFLTTSELFCTTYLTSESIFQRDKSPMLNARYICSNGY